MLLFKEKNLKVLLAGLSFGEKNSLFLRGIPPFFFQLYS